MLQPRARSVISKAILPIIVLTFVNIIVLHVHTEEELPLGSGLVDLREDDTQLAPPCRRAVTLKQHAQVPWTAKRAVVRNSAANAHHTLSYSRIIVFALR